MPGVTLSEDKQYYESRYGMTFQEAWADTAKTTYMDYEPDSSTWIYDPYRSIHYATACLCLPGYVFNLEKERQLKCMYRTCLQGNAKVGLPTDTCEYAYKERECLYIESAQYKEHGYLGGWLDSLWDTLIQNLPSIVLGLAYSATCQEYIRDSGTMCQAPSEAGPLYSTRNVMCAVLGTATSLVELADFIDGGFSFGDYEHTLDGTDYCSGGAQ